jgi:hypothetical protein
VRERVFGFSVALESDTEEAVAGDDIINELGALGGLDEERCDHARENDDIGEAEDGQSLGEGAGRDTRWRFRASGCT